MEGTNTLSHRPQGGSHGEYDPTGPQGTYSRRSRRNGASITDPRARSVHRIDCIYRRFPAPVHDVLYPLAPVFTRSIYRRFVLLVLSASLTTSAHILVNLLCTLGR